MGGLQALLLWSQKENNKFGPLNYGYFELSSIADLISCNISQNEFSYYVYGKVTWWKMWRILALFMYS